MTAWDRRIQPTAAKITPPQHDRACLRPETIAALERACGHRLTLVCAPAGYGKTTTTALGLRQLGLDFVWCKIDVLDRDPAAFVATLVGALRTRYPEFGQAILDRLLYSREAPLPTVELTHMLVDECSLFATHDLLTIIDDYHEASDSPELNQILGDLLVGAPDTMKFVVLSRYDPAFPTGKLRVANEVATIGVDQLRFSADQASAVLELHTGRRHPTDHVERLTGLTEGWPASVVLAGLSHDRLDVDSLEQALADPRMRLDVYTYLAEQVYGGETREARHFLDRTCCLEHITAELANSLAGVENAHRHLDHLTRHRVFTFATDSGAYRYHNLFRDFLKHHFVREHGNAALRDLQRESAAALETEGSIEMAVELLLTAHEPAAALDVIARAGDSGLDSYSTEALQSWLERVPWSMRITEPWPLLLAAQLHVRAGDLRAALTDAQAALSASGSAEDSWAIYHSYSALETAHFWRGDIDARIAACEAALPHASTEEQKLRTLLSVGSAAIEQRDLAKAEAAFLRADGFCRNGSALDIARRQLLRAELEYHRGDFRVARHLVPTVDLSEVGPDMATAILNLAGYIASSLAEYGTATTLLNQARTIAQQYGLALRIHLAEENIGAILGATGRHADGCAMFERSLRAYQTAGADPYLAADAARNICRAHRRTGTIDAAGSAAHSAMELLVPQVGSDAALSIKPELLFAEALAGDGDGSALLELAETAEAAGLMFVSLEARLFDAVLAAPIMPDYARNVLRTCLPEQIRLGHIDLVAQEFCARQDIVTLALSALDNPIDRQNFLSALAHHWDYAAVFRRLAVEEPVVLADAIAAAARHSDDEVLRAVLTAAAGLPGEPLAAAASAAARERGISVAPSASVMTELTPRERQVLRLIANGRRNPEIASDLFLSHATVKTHVNRIFFKLGVTSRVQAVLKYQKATGAEP